MVDREFGTGAVKITPAHDPNDFEAGRRHGLEEICVIGNDGMMTENAGGYAGKDRFTARKEIVKALEASGLLTKIDPHKHAVGHCQRCSTVLEPIISRQWFLKIASLAEPAREVVRNGEVRFTPEHWKKVYLNWMEEIHDWCISRQLWWGHRIPAFSCASCGKSAGENDPEKKLVSMEDLTECPYCGAEVEQDPDVLDTWFSSQLWPFSTMGWPEETDDFKKFYPTHVMETGYDILFFWVARMIMAGMKFTGKPPFKEVFLHGLVRDAQGRKMSKTLGNVVDPVDLIETYGADAVRFTLAILCVPGTDLPLDPKRMEGYRAFGNKLWNAGRYVLMQVGEDVPGRPERDALGPWDRWILEEYARCVHAVNEALEEFKFYEAAQSIYQFVWHKYCDWYVEASKVALRENQPVRRADAARWTLVHVLDGVLRLLHPFMPFITEEMWQRVPGRTGRIMVAPYPVVQAEPPAREAPAIEMLQEAINRIRNVRAEKGLAPKTPLNAALLPTVPEAEPALRASEEEVKMLAHLSELTVTGSAVADAAWTATPSAGFEIFTRQPVAASDPVAERKRLEAGLKKALGEREKFKKKLDNPAFTQKAPPEVVEKNRALCEEFERKVSSIEAALKELKNR